MKPNTSEQGRTKQSITENTSSANVPAPKDDPEQKVSPLEVHDLTVSYNKRPVLWDIDFTLPEGKLIGIVGPNGAGKSTLIKAIMGLVPLSSGYVKVFGEDLDAVRSRVGYVLQRNSVIGISQPNVQDVVLMGRYGRVGLFRRPRASDVDVTNEALHMVGITDLKAADLAAFRRAATTRVYCSCSCARCRSLSNG